MMICCKQASGSGLPCEGFTFDHRLDAEPPLVVIFVYVGCSVKKPYFPTLSWPLMISTLPFAPNDETCREIREAISEWDDTTRVIVGHGSGSFGHVAAAKHSTIDGVSGAVQWRGFCDVSDAASRLNRYAHSVWPDGSSFGQRRR